MAQSASISQYSALELLLESCPAQIWQMTDANTFGRVNAAYAAFLGKPRIAIEHQPVESLLPSAEVEACVSQNRKLFETKHPMTSEEWHLDASGNSRLLRIQKTPMMNETGQVLFLSCSAEDITEQWQAAQELTRLQAQIDEQVTEKVGEAADTLWGTVSSLVHLCETQDENASAHLQRLSEACRVVASVLSFNSVYSQWLTYDFIYKLQQASLLHDIGKASIPDSILQKPGKLTREEFDEVKKHTVIGAQTLEQAYPRLPKGSIFQMAIDIALSHHERWDGKGYPNGLKGDEIPLPAQIVAICDVYDALRNVRPYKPAMTHQESMLEIRRECGTHFNPALCDAFFHCAEEIRHIYDGNSIG